MARDFDGTADYLADTSVSILGTTLPTAFTASIWFYPDVTNVSFGHLSVHDGRLSGGYRGVKIRADAGNNFIGNVQDNSNTIQLVTTNNSNQSAWNHGCLIRRAADSHTLILNGDTANEANDTTTSANPINLDNTHIAADWFNGVVEPFNGRIGEVTCWDSALSDPDVNALAKGMHSLRIRPGDIISYIPIYGTADPEPDYYSTASLALTSAPPQIDHPPVSPPFAFDEGWQAPFSEAAVAAALGHGLLLSRERNKLVVGI